MIRTRYLVDEPPLDLLPLDPIKIIDLGLLASSKDPNAYWLVNRPNEYITTDLTTLCVDDPYLNAVGLDRFVYWADYRVAGRIKDIFERFRSAGVATVGIRYSVGKTYSTPLTEGLIIWGSRDPLKSDDQKYLLDLTKEARPKLPETFRAGLIPYTWSLGVLHILLGKNLTEKHWNSSGKWSDFGGTIEEKDYLATGGAIATEWTELFSKDDYRRTAAREGSEESIGFLGSFEEISLKLANIQPLEVDEENPTSYEYPFYLDPNQSYHWPPIFSKVYAHNLSLTKSTFLRTRISPIGPEGYFEKVEIKWFTLNEIYSEKEINWRFRDYLLSRSSSFKRPQNKPSSQ